MSYTPRFAAFVVAGLVAAFAAGTASAKDKAVPPPLPGVKAGYSIVKPVPEPDDAVDDATNGGHFKVGDMDVRIGGSIIVDVRAGSLRPPNH